MDHESDEHSSKAEKKRSRMKAPKTLVHTKHSTNARWQRAWCFEYQNKSYEDPNPNRFKLQESRENVQVHLKKGTKYQVYYKGRPIDTDTQERKFARFISKDSAGLWTCEMHGGDCHSGSGKNKSLKQIKFHLSKYLFKYVCCACGSQFGTYSNLYTHFDIKH